MDNPKSKTRVRTSGRGVTRTVTKTKDISPTGTKTKTRTFSRTKDLGLGNQKKGTVGSTGVSAKSGTKSLVKQKTIAKSAFGDKVKSKTITGSVSKQGNSLTRDGFNKISHDQKFTATKTKASRPGSNSLKSNEKRGSFSSKYSSEDSPYVKNMTYKEAKSKAKKYSK